MTTQVTWLHPHSAATATWRKDKGFVQSKTVGGAGWTRKRGEGRNATESRVRDNWPAQKDFPLEKD